MENCLENKSENEVQNDKLAYLNKLLASKYFNKANDLEITSTQTQYSVTNRQVSAVPVYKILWSHLIDNPLMLYTLYTQDFSLRRGFVNGVCFRTVSVKKFAKQSLSDQWVGKIQGTFCEVTPALNIYKFIERLNANNLWTWKELVNIVADGTGIVSKDVKDIMLASVLRLPVEYHEKLQPFNNHSILVTNSHIGKTESYKRITGYDAGSDYSIAGLFGGFNDKNIKEGILNGEGFHAFDEFPTFNKDKISPMENLLQYCNNGTTTRQLVDAIRCVGTKTISFFGNVDSSKYGEDALFKLLDDLKGKSTLGALGTRLGHVIYGINFRFIDVVDSYDKALVQNIRLAGEVMMLEKRGEILKVINYFKPILEKIDSEYVDYFEDMSKLAHKEGMHDFLRGFKHSWLRVRMGALKKAIYENLDSFYTLPFKDLIKKIEFDFFVNYESLRNYNFKSFGFLEISIKAKVLEHIQKGGFYEELAGIGINIARSTFYNYKKSLGGQDGKS
jgi:hypothetical protein